jgi:hypothetical protein
MMEARHFYLAVADAATQKVPTVAAFATAAAAAAASPVRAAGLAVACGDRASLDECAVGLAGSGFEVILAHSDLSQSELEAAAGRVTAAAAAAAAGAQGAAAAAAQGDAAGGSGRPAPFAFVATDAALRALPRESPLGVPLLIHFDPPTTREAHALRLAAAFGAGKRRAGRGGGIAVHIAVAGELEAFRAAEAAVGAPISELPVHIPSLFAPPPP